MMSNRNFSRGGELPIVMSRAFSQNPGAAKVFSSLGPLQRQKFIDGSFTQTACANMSVYVDCCEEVCNNMSCFDDIILY